MGLYLLAERVWGQIHRGIRRGIKARMWGLDDLVISLYPRHHIQADKFTPPFNLLQSAHYLPGLRRSGVKCLIQITHYSTRFKTKFAVKCVHTSDQDKTGLIMFDNEINLLCALWFNWAIITGLGRISPFPSTILLYWNFSFLQHIEVSLSIYF